MLEGWGEVFTWSEGSLSHFVLMKVVITILLKSIFICFYELLSSTSSSLPSSTHSFIIPFLKYIAINTILFK